MANVLKQALFEEITTDATLLALISTRCFPDYADQTTTMPYITYQEFGNDGVHQFQGVDSLDKATYQFSIWAVSSTSRTDVENALRILLDGQRRAFGTGGNRTFVNRSENTNNLDTIEEPDDGSQDVVFGKFMDFDFWHLR